MPLISTSLFSTFDGTLFSSEAHSSSNPTSCGCIHLTTQAETHFLWLHSPFVPHRYAKSSFKDKQMSPSAGWSISGGLYKLVKADGRTAHTKRTLRPDGLRHSVGSLGCAALKPEVSFSRRFPRPFERLRSA